MRGIPTHLPLIPLQRFVSIFQAYQMRPSIIFFDEIDGLAPIRSSRQDQIHSSIVSTLLALMDGLDSRGEIVVIGATNRCVLATVCSTSVCMYVHVMYVQFTSFVRVS